MRDRATFPTVAYDSSVAHPVLVDFFVLRLSGFHDVSPTDIGGDRTSGWRVHRRGFLAAADETKGAKREITSMREQKHYRCLLCCVGKRERGGWMGPLFNLDLSHSYFPSVTEVDIESELILGIR